MRNYLKCWISTEWTPVPGFGPVLQAWAWFATEEEAKAWSFGPLAPDQYLLVTPGWVEMNKAHVLKLLSLWNPIEDKDPNGNPIFITDENPRYNPKWPSSDGPGPHKPGQGSGVHPQTLTVELYLALLVRTYEAERKYQAAVQAAQILRQLLNKSITPDEALAEAALLPKTT